MKLNEFIKIEILELLSGNAIERTHKRRYDQFIVRDDEGRPLITIVSDRIKRVESILYKDLHRTFTYGDDGGIDTPEHAVLRDIISKCVIQSNIQQSGRNKLKALQEFLNQDKFIGHVEINDNYWRHAHR